MARDDQNESQREETSVNPKQGPEGKVPQARPGGQIDSSTGGKPGGGGQPQSGKK